MTGSDEDRLKWAVEEGNATEVELLLEQGANPGLKDESQQMPLVWAAKAGQTDVVRLLLEKDVEIDSRDEEGRTPLSYAAEEGHAAVVSLLLDKGADVHSRDEAEWTPLMSAAMRGHEAVASLLLEGGAGPDTRDNDGWSPLLHAAADGHAGVVSLLLERGADPDIRDEEQQSAISWAAEHGHLAVVELLLARNVSPNDDETDQTPLAKALDHSFDTEDYTIVKLLLKHGADPFSEVYWDNRSPLELAAANGLKEMVALFLSVDAVSSRAKQDHVREAICKAAMGRREDLLELLFAHYSPEETDLLTPWERVSNQSCGCTEEISLSLLRPYLPPGTGGEEKESADK
ncbi:hypothetical protein QQX98_006946 [Neonectria punicea]|uniref:Ankyrin n=1 Tax=Neonectria punicea TaxID=979145 RepID=A0ABR1GZ89_9HYPO